MASPGVATPISMRGRKSSGGFRERFLDLAAELSGHRDHRGNVDRGTLDHRHELGPVRDLVNVEVVVEDEHVMGRMLEQVMVALAKLTFAEVIERDGGAMRTMNIELPQKFFNERLHLVFSSFLSAVIAFNNNKMYLSNYKDKKMAPHECDAEFGQGEITIWQLFSVLQ